MNVAELMSFTPSRDPRHASTSQKRHRPNETHSLSMPSDEATDYGRASSTPYLDRKKPRTDRSKPNFVDSDNLPAQVSLTEPGHAPLRTGHPPTLTEEERVALLSQIAQLPEEPMDSNALRKLAANLEKRMARNQELRVRHVGQPEKFVDSECDLNDAIADMHAVATNPELYGEFIRLGLLERIVQLLSHENTDIACAVADLLQEMTDIDPEHESRRDAVSLVENLIHHHGVDALVVLLNRLNENVPEESQAVHNILAVFENIADLRPESADESVGRSNGKTADLASSSLIESGMLIWLLKRIKTTTFDANKLYASEILAIFLQHSEVVKKKFGEKDGLEITLRQLASYRKVDPKLADEYELVENLFNILCSAMMLRANLRLFVEAEGIQLLLIMVRNRKAARGGALRVLDYVLTIDGSSASKHGESVGRASRTFIEVLGMAAIFPIFMKPPKQYNRSTATQQEMEEWATSIICSLIRNTPFGDCRKRLLAKFSENGCEKLDRLMELHKKYAQRVAAAENDLQETIRLLERESNNDAEQLRDELYFSRLDAGLFMQQRLTIVMLILYAEAGREVAKHVGFLLKMHKSLESFQSVIEEYVENLGDDDAEFRQREEQEVRTLLATLCEKERAVIPKPSETAGTSSVHSILKK